MSVDSVSYYTGQKWAQAHNALDKSRLPLAPLRSTMCPIDIGMHDCHVGHNC